MNETKVKAFVAHIVEECEQEGLTLSEALSIPQRIFSAAQNSAKVGLVPSIRNISFTNRF